MADINGYFQIVIRDDGTYLHLFPSSGSGLPVNMKDLEDYLYIKKIDYDKVPLFSAVGKNADMTVRLNGNKCYKIPETLSLSVTEDKMQVIGRFYPPTEGADLVSAEEIKRDLLFKKIKAELNQASVEDFFRNRKYCTDYLIAEGNKVIEGTDGKVEYLFDTDMLAKPKENEDGSVDFHELGTVRACASGQVLARLTKEIPGQYGSNVFGELIKPKDVKKAVFHHGRDISVSEDGNELISDINGHVSLTNGSVFVSGVLEIVNVDVSTGNIRYEGNLVISGNVTTGYEVIASGDVDVKGIVEGATIEAGGQIMIEKGVNGMGRGILKAGTNIVAKYINDASVEAGGFVQSECIINSSVNAHDRIVVEGRKGFISGGFARAGNIIEAKTIGSDMGVDTSIEVGVDPKLKLRFSKLQKDNAELQKNIARIEPVLVAVSQKLKKGEKLPPEQIKKMQELAAAVSAQKTQLKLNTEELGQLSMAFDTTTAAQVIVHGDAYPGTKIKISEEMMTLKSQYHYCRFIKDAGEVKMVGM